MVTRGGWLAHKMLPHNRLEEVGFERQKSWVGFTRRLTKSNNSNSCGFSSDSTWSQSDFSQRTNNLQSAISSSPLFSLASLDESQQLRNIDYGKDSSAFPVSDRQPWHIDRMKHKNNRRRTVKCEEDNSGNFLMVWNRSIPLCTTTSSTNNTVSCNTNINNNNWSFSPTIESLQHSTNTNSQADNVDKVVATTSICIPSLTDRNGKTFQGLQSSVAPTMTFQKAPSLCSKPTYPTGSISWLGSRTVNKEAELLYQDPVSGAPTSFLQRLNEIAALEAETVRLERARKLKKKNKHDKESYSY
ncbi:uncharacterized protein LOC106881565 isoform X2 [Octopus bimaculoides]|uniref:uncharacterized protein LOC106881565 isoform X2 n=1 Tax=Octopus bimaculoides TaxID=37653 RepID=UPI00071C940E|nr:uncharacterized protein LOC106881565 isoform X2 [Octopus bimaculoides]|eukprot:XP_014787500.1 PREDICTED: uncharacterized protein LOC106881565 isoform X2 [Octopus bimaculoides]